MKNLTIIFLLIVSVNLSAQTKTQNWLTDYQEATKTSETRNNPILVFVTDNTNSEKFNLLQDEVFNSEIFKRYASSFVLLKLDVTSDSYHKRLASHYTKSNNVPALVLIDDKGNSIEKALTEINSKNISEFMAFLKTKTKY
ncbi:thioredoxin family protein [Psychroserpens mesophilus]|uniref:thioredoxin family protein n=1 Tax=Psychroserpens mesophilus TaxID=325473 RepID=UPI000AE3B155|nr:thioredoxin family protein [Psychroserpens mesophilus]